MTPKNDTSIDLNVTTESYTMSVDNTYYESVLTRAPIETPKTSSQPAADTLSSSRYNPRTDSTSTLYPSDASPDALTSSSKSNNKTESIQEGVK